MPTLNSDVTVTSYNIFYLFSMKYLYRNDSIWKFVLYDLSNILEWFNANFQMYIIKNIAAKTGY
jgi:hypothetical protein